MLCSELISNRADASQDMYRGVLRDDVRRREKMAQRQAEFEESQRKRELYERVQKVVKSES